MNALVSVIIPCYNHGRFLPEALDSVLAQTYMEWEAIVIDDGSKDDTAQVGRRFADKDSRIRYVYQENGGESAARNRGLDLARGEYVAFLDADDFYVSTALADHTAFLDANQCFVVSYSDGYFCSEQGRRLFRLSETRTAPYEGIILEQLVLGPHGLIPSCTMTRLEAIRERQLCFDLDLTIGPDWDFWIRLSEDAQFGYLDQVTCMYRIHGSSITRTSGRQKRQRDLLRGRLKVMRAPWFEGLSTEIKRAFFAHVLNDITMGLADEQRAIIASPAFCGLAATDRSILLRQLATHCILTRQDGAITKRHLEEALVLSPDDHLAMLLLTVLRLNPRLGYAAAWSWRQRSLASRAVARLGRRHPRPVPRALRPDGA